MIIFNRPQRGIYNIKTNQDIGTMIKKDRMVRSSQMITISLMETGISVATTQGIVVENIKTWVILMTLMIKAPAHLRRPEREGTFPPGRGRPL